MAAASFKESGSDHMWTVLFFFHGVVQRHLLIILTAGRNYRLGLSSRKFFLLLTSLTAATSSGTVNELSAFKNLFHLVCPYFTDHARIGTGYLVIACGSLTSSGTYVKIKFSIVKCMWTMKPDKILALYLS
ncbi:uncharacterized protein [Dysidea avara]|uniref:uncharacterized protein isoform X2 n=1 Tax=Dysidea avara TaxID=196820 RepID=UPI00332F9565